MKSPALDHLQPIAQDIWEMKYRLKDPSGAPIEGATLNVTPFMPEHQHGSPLRVQVSAAGQPGQYTLSPVNLWMPGVWETTIRATSGTTTDSAVYRFCIN